MQFDSFEMDQIRKRVQKWVSACLCVTFLKQLWCYLAISPRVNLSFACSKALVLPLSVDCWWCWCNDWATKAPSQMPAMTKNMYFSAAVILTDPILRFDSFNCAFRGDTLLSLAIAGAEWCCELEEGEDLLAMLPGLVRSLAAKLRRWGAFANDFLIKSEEALSLIVTQSFESLLK
mgnify:CR=1 FL=1